jgi:hypothetical protein
MGEVKHTSPLPNPTRKAVHHPFNAHLNDVAGADHVGIEGGGMLRLGGKHGNGDWCEVRRVLDNAGTEIQIFVGTLSKRGSSALPHLSPVRDAACLIVQLY